MSSLRAILTDTYQRHGELTPEIVVDDARPADSVLHNRFEWDDSIAGEAWRREQAADLIRSVRISFSDDATGERKFVRAFQSRVRAGDRERGGYVPTEEIATDDVSRTVLLREMRREVDDLRRRYGHLGEFFDAIRSITAA